MNTWLFLMSEVAVRAATRSACVLCIALIAGCGGGGGGGGSAGGTPTVPSTPGAGGGGNSDEPVAPPPNAPAVMAFETAESTSRFLTQATFGSSLEEIRALTGTQASDWFLQQLREPPGYLLPVVDEFSAIRSDEFERTFLAIEAHTIGFWRNAIGGRDQLRQRMAFALSQILVVSNGGGELLTDVPEAVAYYQDLLIRHALGNYRDLLQDVTYSPAMGYYLTYLGSEKGDPATGRMPDENYARELMQLFTIGVAELNADGTQVTGNGGSTVETYGNADVTGLARVFTGLDIDPRFAFEEDGETEAETAGYLTPLAIYPERHSERDKTFLGTTIPAGTPGAESINLALDHLFAHPNVAPFIGKQLIQRLVMSNPSPAYVARVAQVFDTGVFELPSGDVVGAGRRGDLTATAAAILFDTEARNLGGQEGGKIREPLLRFSHWARAFRVSQPTVEYTERLWDTSAPLDLGQHPYRAPSVFNFFRPGHIAQGSMTGERGLVAPELQIVNASSVPGYNNFITDFIFLEPDEERVEELQAIFDEDSIQLDASPAITSFQPDYSPEVALADNPAALLDQLDLLLTYGTLSKETREDVLALLEQLPLDEEEARIDRVRFAVFLLMTSPDYLVQR